MTCYRVGKAIVCDGGNTISYGGYLFEFPPIGGPAMLDPKTLCPIDNPPKDFWLKVNEYMVKELTRENKELKKKISELSIDIDETHNSYISQLAEKDGTIKRLKND